MRSRRWRFAVDIRFEELRDEISDRALLQKSYGSARSFVKEIVQKTAETRMKIPENPIDQD